MLSGISANQAINFAAALEVTTADEGAPIKFEPGLQRLATASNKMFLPYTDLVNLDCEEGAAVVVTDLIGLFK